MNPITNALHKAQQGAPNATFRKLAKQGVKNKMQGIVIRTDPSTTAKGNKTCAICKEAKRTGAPLPPQHRNCRCSIQKV